MTIAEYEIGANHGDLTPLSELDTPIRRGVRSDRLSYSTYRERGDGSRQGQGWLKTTWHFNGITVAEWTQLKEFEGPCNILTPDNDDDMVEFEARMVLPDEEPEHYGGGVLDVSIEFRQLVPV